MKNTQERIKTMLDDTDDQISNLENKVGKTLNKSRKKKKNKKTEYSLRDLENVFEEIMTKLP